MGRTRAIQPNTTTTLPPGDSLTINNKGFATISLGLYEMEPEIVPPTFAEKCLGNFWPVAPLFWLILAAIGVGGSLTRWNSFIGMALMVVGMIAAGFCMTLCMRMSYAHRSLRVKYFIKTGEQP